MSVAITADQLTKEIKGRKIVNQLSFTINKGEVFGLLGPNGAGKTTTIEHCWVLNGLIMDQQKF